MKLHVINTSVKDVPPVMMYVWPIEGKGRMCVLKEDQTPEEVNEHLFYAASSKLDEKMLDDSKLDCRNGHFERKILMNSNHSLEHSQ